MSLTDLKKKKGYLNINRNKKNKYVQNLFGNYQFLKNKGPDIFQIEKKINFNRDIRIT